MNKNKVAVFGCGQRAKEIKYLLEAEKNIITDFFVVDKQYINFEYIEGCRVIDTESFLNDFSPSQTKVYLGVGMPKMNRVRERLFKQFNERGFHFEQFISENATVYAEEIGEGTTVFAGVNIGPHVRIGKGNHFEMGVTVSHDCKIGDFNFFAPGAALCGDIKIGKGSFIGANSTLRNSITIGDYILVGAGAYVDRSIASEKVIVPSRSMILDNKTSEDFMK